MMTVSHSYSFIHTTVENFILYSLRTVLDWGRSLAVKTTPGGQGDGWPQSDRHAYSRRIMTVSHSVSSSTPPWI